MDTIPRRAVLKTAAAIPFAAVAGCTTAFGDDDEPPAYHGGLPHDGANDEPGVFLVHIDTAWLREFDDDTELPYEDQLPDAVDTDLDPDTAPVDVDPLIAYPFSGFFIGVFGVAFGLIPYGFGDRLLSSLDEDDGVEGQPVDDAESTADDGATDDDGSAHGDVRVDSILLVDGVAVFGGSFDERAIVAASDGFEPAGERGEFDVYEGTEEGVFGTEGLAFAVRDDTLVVLLDPDSDLEAVVDAVSDSTDRLSDDDDGDWALRTAGHGHMTLGAWGTDPDDAIEDDEPGVEDDGFVDVERVLDDADGFISSLTFGLEEAGATLAAAFPEGETPEADAFEEEIGTSATTREIDVDGTRVSVTGAWRASDDE